VPPLVAPISAGVAFGLTAIVTLAAVSAVYGTPRR
jgi:hypothetical protein